MQQNNINHEADRRTKIGTKMITRMGNAKQGRSKKGTGATRSRHTIKLIVWCKLTDFYCLNSERCI